MFKLETLDVLKDEELQGVIAHSQTLLKAREEQRKKDAIEKARAALAAVGLNFRDVAGKAKGGNGKTTAYKGGMKYRHPDDKNLVWNAVGQKPNWIRDLEAAGRRPVEVAGEAGAS